VSRKSFIFLDNSSVVVASSALRLPSRLPSILPLRALFDERVGVDFDVALFVRGQYLLQGGRPFEAAAVPQQSQVAEAGGHVDVAPARCRAGCWPPAIRACPGSSADRPATRLRLAPERISNGLEVLCRRLKHLRGPPWPFLGKRRGIVLNIALGIEAFPCGLQP